ncbi:MAG TPA: hypothetical protein PKH77_00345 [Anaerolineae bacterium]|nr:hypothetical protein [Anaerolineae bacterium]
MMTDKKLPWIMHIPPGVLTKALYAWLPIVALWHWPPVISGLLLAYLGLSITLLRMQQNCMRRLIKANALDSGEFIYEERLKLPLRPLLLNLLLVVGIGVLVGGLLRDRLMLSGLQWALLVIGMVVTEQFVLLLWAPDRHLVTEGGIWGVTSTLSFFIRHGAIARVEVVQPCALPQRFTYTLFPIKVPLAVFLLPVDKEGFTWFVKEVVLIPQDAERLLAQFPPHLLHKSTD